MKRVSRYALLFLMLLLAACAPGAEYPLPPGLTIVPGTDIPQQVATFISDALTQTAIVIPATATPAFEATPSGYESPTPAAGSGILPAPVPFPYQTHYQSPTLGIQFIHPSTWYRSEANGVVTLTSFDPANPPHKLEWTYETTSMQFGYKVFFATPASFEAWVEEAKQAAQAEGWSISSEERLLIANQPAARLSLVSGSGGILNRVLIYGLSGRYFEVNIEGNYNNNLAKTVLDSVQPSNEGVLKPPDAETPAAGVCSGPQGDPASVILGLDASGMPIGGRCVIIDPAQRLKFVNQAGSPIYLSFAGYTINLLAGGEMLVDKPVGQYLALGVHFLSIGPELWVKTAAGITPVVTAPPPIVEYNNSVFGYRLNLPGNWSIDENGMTAGASKEVTFNPPNPEPFIAYLSISLEYSRTLDQVIQSYAEYHPDAVREDTIFNGYPAMKYTFASGSNHYFIPYGNQVFAILTERPNDGTVQSILMTFRFTTPPQPATYEATMADNGRTFQMKIGETLRLNLDPAYDWSAVSVSDMNILAVTQGVYLAQTAGIATLSTNGNPKCVNSSPPCAIPSINLSITVVVQPSYTTYEATIMDNGKTFYMKVGDILKLKLDWSYDWSTTSVSNTNVIAGVQDGHTALSSGAATLTTYGNPKCYSSTPPCLVPSIMFTVIVIVQ